MPKFTKLTALTIALAFTTLAASAATFEWVREDIDVYDLRVISVNARKGELQAHIANIGTRKFSVPADFRFQIAGVPTPLADLVPRQRLRAYVTRSPAGTLQLVDAGPVKEVVPVETPKPPIVAEVVAPMQTALLPKTGSFMPLSLLLALGSGGLALTLRRRRR